MRSGWKSVRGRGIVKRITIRYRPIAAAVSAGAAFLVFVALGGAGLMQSAVSLAQYQYGKKVVICHKGKKTITVSVNAWPAHERHGDTKGPCPDDAQADETGKKGKKAKDKGPQATESDEQASGGKGKKPKPKKGTNSSSSTSSDAQATPGKAKKKKGRQAEQTDQTGNGKPTKAKKKAKGSGKPEKSKDASPPASVSNDSAPPEGGNGKGNGKNDGKENGKGNGKGKGKGRGK